MMETLGYLVVGMPLKVAWSSVTEVSGVLFAVTGGDNLMLEWPAVNLDSQLLVGYTRTLF